MTSLRRASSLLGLLATACVVALGVLAVSTVRGDQRGNRSTVVQGQSLDAQVGSGINDLGSIPFDLAPSLVLWTGSELLVLGHSNGTNPGPVQVAAYHPDDGQWELLPDAPFDRPIASFDGVWNGKTAIVVGAQCAKSVTEDQLCEGGSLAASELKPEDRSWSNVDMPSSLDFAATNDGTFGYAVGQANIGSVFVIERELWAYSANGSSWMRLPRPPQPSDVLCISGGQLVGGGGIPAADTPLGSPDPYDIEGAQLAVLDPDSKDWSPITRLDIKAEFPNIVTYLCSDTGVIATTENFDQAFSFSFDDAMWAAFPTPTKELVEQPFAEGYTRAPGISAPTSTVNRTFTGGGFVWWNPPRQYELPVDGETRAVTFPGNAFVYVPAEQTWRSAQPGPQAYGPSDARRFAWVHGFAFSIAAVDATDTPHLVTYQP